MSDSDPDETDPADETGTSGPTDGSSSTTTPATTEPAADGGTAAGAAGDTTTAPPRRRGRGALSITLAVLTGILLPLAGITVFLRNQLLDTDRYVSTVAPLAADPAVQRAAAARLTTVVSDAVDFQAVAKDALPERAQALAGPIAAGAQQLVGQIADKIVTSDQFRTAWEAANRASHKAVVAALTGEGTKSVETKNGEVVLQLRPLAERVISGVDDRTGLDLASRIPTDKLDASFVLLRSEDLAKVQDAVRWLDRLTWFLWIAAVLCLLGAIFAAVPRRKGVRRAGWAVTISSAVVLAALAVARDRYLTALPRRVSQPAAAATYDIMVHNLRIGFRIAGLVGVVLLLGSFVRLPAPGSEPGPVPRWVAAHAPLLRTAVLLVAALAFLLLDQPAVGSVVTIVVVAAVLLGVIQLLVRSGRAATGPIGPGGPVGPTGTDEPAPAT